MSPERLKELQREVTGIRRRLEDWARRLAALRATTSSGDVGAGDVEATPPPALPGAADLAGAAPRVPPAPLFQRSGLGGPLDDVELTFEVLDTEDPGREGR